jgi:predicted flap endonuclease-1-like 5' DNA nuclease
MLWIAIIVVVVIIVLLLWWWLSRCPAEPAATYQPPRPQVDAEPPALRAAPVAAPEVKVPPASRAAELPVAEPEVEVPTASLAAAAPAIVAEEPVAPPAPVAAPPMPAQPDDLKIIEGIGPKISSILQGHGITTFAQLAATDVERLREIMLSVNLRIADPTTWPEQAALAAAGKRDELQTLQNNLKGGRKA